MDIAVFTCSICGEESKEICVYCTKDTCGNHLCERCHRCSDCCRCALRLTKVYGEERRSLPHSTHVQPPPDAPAEKTDKPDRDQL